VNGVFFYGDWMALIFNGNGSNKKSVSYKHIISHDHVIYWYNNDKRSLAIVVISLGGI
jgi:hypothetical protein